MQHGTGREAALELIENVEATLNTWGGRPYNDLIRALQEAARILQVTPDLDERGQYGRDYAPRGLDDLPRVSKAERDEAFVVIGALEVTEDNLCFDDCHRSLAEHPWHDD